MVRRSFRGHHSRTDIEAWRDPPLPRVVIEAARPQSDCRAGRDLLRRPEDQLPGTTDPTKASWSLNTGAKRPGRCSRFEAAEVKPAESPRRMASGVELQPGPDALEEASVPTVMLPSCVACRDLWEALTSPPSPEDHHALSTRAADSSCRRFHPCRCSRRASCRPVATSTSRGAGTTRSWETPLLRSASSGSRPRTLRPTGGHGCEFTRLPLRPPSRRRRSSSSVRAYTDAAGHVCSLGVRRRVWLRHDRAVAEQAVQGSRSEPH